MLAQLAPVLNAFLSAVSIVFGLSMVLHGILVLPLMLTHRLLALWAGWDV
jgi:hypothetical protein